MRLHQQPPKGLLFLAGTAAFLGLAAGASAQNLLTNPGFEAGLQGWTSVTGSAATLSYGAIGAPSFQVSTTIGGFNRLLKDGGGNSVLEQTVVTGPIAGGTHVEAAGFFGGLGTSEASCRLVVRFLTAGGAEIGIRSLRSVTRANRNDEDVLMWRRGQFEIPAQTQQIVARLEFANPCCGGPTGTADEIYLGLSTAPLIPPPLPLDVELIGNGHFESGWGPGSPLTLVDENGWEGTGGTSLVRFYSSSDPMVPSPQVASVVGGGANLLVDRAGEGGVRQQLDLRGNATQIASGLALVVSAHEGGWNTSEATARVDVRFLNASFSPVGLPAPPVGPVSRAMRNGETVVMKREGKYSIPQGAAYALVEVAFSAPCCGGSTGMLDNVSARLVVPTAPAAQPLNVNVVRNGSFESGSVGGSPLQLDDASSWVGTTNGRATVTSYGANSEVPSPAFSFARGLGGLVLDDLTGNSGLAQSFDLSGMQTLISQGNLLVTGSVWLGGFSNNQDHATATIRFFNEFDVQVGLQRALGPVTAADRGNVTSLERRTDAYVVPLGTAKVRLELSFTHFCCGGITGLADGIELFFSDGTSFGNRYCTANPNSTGSAASISVVGSDLVAMNSTTLTGVGLPPSAFAFFLASQNRAFVPNPAGSAGNLCLGGSIGRYVGPNQIRQASTTGDIALDINLGAIPTPNGLVAAMAGDTWNFQAWYRDAAAGTPTSNFTDGVEVLFR